MKLIQVFCLISSLTATIALPKSFPRNDVNPKVVDRASGDSLEVSERGDRGLVLHEGKIAVKAANGASLGFISKFKSDFGTYVADSHKGHAAIFSFSAKKFGTSSGLLLKDETTDTKRTPYLGGVIPHGYNLERGGRKRASANSAKGAGTERSEPNRPPHKGGGSYNSAGHGPVQRSLPEARGDWSSNDIESAIWTYNAKTKEFSAVWTNPGHSHLDITLFYDTCKPFGLVLVSDVNGYSFSNPEAFQISLHFVPNHEKEDGW